MDNEKQLLTNELSGIEKKEDLQKFIEDVELLGHEDIVALAQEKIKALESQAAESVTAVSDSEKSEIESLGGNSKELEEKTAPLQKEMEAVRQEAGEEIAAVGESLLEGSAQDRLARLESFKNDPRFETWLAETKKYYKMKEDLKNNQFLRSLPEGDNQRLAAITLVQEQNAVRDNLGKALIEDHGSDRFSSSFPLDIDELIESAKKEIQQSPEKLAQELRAAFAGNKNTYAFSDTDKSLHEVVKDENYEGGLHVRQVQRSNEAVDDVAYVSLSEDSYDKLLEAYKIAVSRNAVENTGAYSGYSDKNTFTAEKLADILEK